MSSDKFICQILHTPIKVDRTEDNRQRCFATIFSVVSIFSAHWNCSGTFVASNFSLNGTSAVFWIIYKKNNRSSYQPPFLPIHFSVLKKGNRLFNFHFDVCLNNGKHWRDDLFVFFFSRFFYSMFDLWLICLQIRLHIFDGYKDVKWNDWI